MGRFELKIISIVVLVALGSLVAATLLVKRVVRDSISLGVNKNTLSSLRFAIETARSYRRIHRQSFTLAQAYLSGNQRLLELVSVADAPRVRAFLGDLVARYDFIRSVTISTKPGSGATGSYRVFVQVHAVRKRKAAAYQAFTYTKELLRRAGGHVRFNVVFLFPKAFTEELEQTIRWEQAYRTIFENVHTREKLFSEKYSTAFILIYALILLVIVVLAVWTTRRVTGRIAALAEGTREVTAGNLEVRLSSTQDDELGDLISAFNRMVVELQASRQKIAYLNKISGWQGIARRLAHEIKNPLTPILLAVQQVQSKYDGDDGRFKKLLGDSLEIVSEEIAGLRRLVNEFSEFAKLPEVALEQGEGGAFLEDFLRRHNHFAEQVQLTWTREGGHRPVLLRFDKLLLQRVLYNLIENAVQSQRASGSSDVTLITRVVLETGTFEIRVADRGPGIPDEEKSKIFEPYFTTKEEGTGLGLAISKKIVLEHNGRISVEDRVGGGTVFVVELPITQAERS